MVGEREPGEATLKDVERKVSSKQNYKYNKKSTLLHYSDQRMDYFISFNFCRGSQKKCDSLHAYHGETCANPNEKVQRN